ncbi:GGDEF domain-containing protein [Teredinibacter purpureus]|uniref:GGDEF domain-containing protein n=1 Tax=Teredinibacter purpureus TaxID=2731756 RepID=UPI0005F8115E|nr:GGDEF domain-containing protein [Teredinibacter purpureus]
MVKGYLSIQLKSQWLYLAFLLTILAIFAYDWIPPRSLTLLTPGSTTSLYMDSENTGTSVGEWLDKTNHAFRCTFYDTPAHYKYCGFDVLQGDGLSAGIDYSHYTTLKIKLHYKGDAELLRFYVRHFAHGLSNVNDTRNTAKYARVLVATNDLNIEVSLPLTQFSLANWWVRAMNLPTELSYPEFSNAINIGIDHPYPARIGVHDIQVAYIRLEGIWLTKESWYLGIVGFWFLILVLKNLQQLFHYRSLLTRNTEQLDYALTKAEKLEAESNRFKELSLIDQLTSTLNRRGIQREVDKIDRQSKWSDTAIVLMDIDFFKPINDSYGHDVGDKVLESLGAILRDAAGTRGYAGRWGGEEFILLFSGTSVMQARDTAEAIRQRIANFVFCGELNIRLTASFGVGTAAVDECFEDTFRHVDRALYLAKNSGRNCVKTAE